MNCAQNTGVEPRVDSQTEEMKLIASELSAARTDEVAQEKGDVKQRTESVGRINERLSGQSRSPEDKIQSNKSRVM
jgi:hypothetical protein